MNAEEFLKRLSEHDSVFEQSDDFEYTEQQLMDLAERYHQYKLKELIPDDEQITVVLDKAYKEAGPNAYFGNGFTIK